MKPRPIPERGIDFVCGGIAQGERSKVFRYLYAVARPPQDQLPLTTGRKSCRRSPPRRRGSRWRACTRWRRTAANCQCNGRRRAWPRCRRRQARRLRRRAPGAIGAPWRSTATNSASGPMPIKRNEGQAIRGCWCRPAACPNRPTEQPSARARRRRAKRAVRRRAARCRPRPAACGRDSATSGGERGRGKQPGVTTNLNRKRIVPAAAAISGRGPMQHKEDGCRDDGRQQDGHRHMRGRAKIAAGRRRRPVP